jgi:hypothetical protein
MPRRRAVAHRLLAGLFALWFAVSATEGARAHACPAHDGAPIAEAAMAGSTLADVAHAGHGETHAAPTAPGDGHHDGGSHRCSCPDASCGSTVVALATPRLSTHFGIAVADVRSVLGPATTYVPVAVAHLTPFANGPPAGALA